MSGTAPDAAAIAALLAPIAADSPAGRDVRHEGDYARITEARREEDPNLPRGVWTRDLKQADWALVERLCTDTLTRRSKDLRVACWLCEAWVQRRRFAGLAPGFLLLDALCRDYWDGLYPTLEADGAAARATTLDWLNDRLPVVIRQLPLLTNANVREAGYAWSDYLAAARLESVRLRDPAAAAKAEAGGAVVSAMIDAACDRTPTALLSVTATALDDSLTALAALDATLDARCGREAPGLGKIRSALDDIRDFVHAALDARDPRSILPPPVVVDVVPNRSQPNAATPADVPSSRDAAYRQLVDIAALLRRIEPHSPVPDLLDRIAGWGQMSLQEIQRSLREHDSDVSCVLQVLGFLDARENHADAEFG